MRRTREEAEETKQRIIEAAVELFETRGYTATRIQDIADLTGLTRGAVYFHFKNKDELYLHIFDMFDKSLDRLLEESKKKDGTPLDRLRWLIVQMVSSPDIMVGFRQIRMAAVTDYERMHGSGKLKQRRERIAAKYLDVAKNCIGQAKNSGEIRQDVDPGMASWMIAIFVAGSVGAQLNNLPAARQYDMADFVDLVLCGLKADNNH